MDIKYGRKRSGIVKQLHQKVSEWISTIEDEKVQKLARRDTIVMGGAIASMLLGEEINDYDVYFKTKKTAVAVAEYYCEKFNKKGEGVNFSKETQPFVKETQIKNIKGVLEDRVGIYIPSEGVAGENQEQYEQFGMNGEGSQDIDEDESIPAVMETNKDQEKYKYAPVFLSQNAITLSGGFQIVIRFFGDPEVVFESYDFIHAMNYYTYKENELVVKPEALEALLSRTLVYKGSLYPIASIWRMKKFINRGWRISAGQQLKIMWQISEINLRNRDTLREQLTGVDAAYLSLLIATLEAIDDNEYDKVDSTYVATIIDRIFDE